MHLQSHSSQSTTARRVFNALVIASLLLAVLPAISPPPAQAQNGGLATYIAEKYNCEPGFDPAAVDPATAIASCTELAGGVGFTLSTTDPNYPGDTRNTGGNGQAVWNDIPSGTAYSVAEAIPASFGVPWVYCEVTQDPAIGGSDVHTSYFQAPGGVMDVGLSDPSLTAYRQAYCRWFNLPPVDGSIALIPQDDLPDADVGEILPVGTGRIIATKRYCPTGFELTDPFSDRSGACQLEGPEVTFTLTYGAGVTSSQPTNKSLNAIGHFTQWMDIPAGAFQITEDAIEGYATLGVACIAVPEGVTPTSLENAWSPENNWAEYQLPEDQVVVCDWFNVRLPTAADAGAVSISKEYCEAGYAPPDIGATYRSNDCRSGGLGSDPAFALTYGGQPATPPDEQNARNSTWYGIPGDTLSITEEPPDMYETVAVYCESFEGVDPNNPSSAAKPPPVRLEHNGNTLNWDLVDGYYLSCIWQNVPVEGAYGNLLIIKRLCPEGYTFGSKPLEDVVNECAEHQTGVQINLEYEAGETTQATTQQGEQGAVASFLEQPPGNVRVSETPPEGYALRRVYCTKYLLSDDPELPDTSNSDQETVTDNSFPSAIDAGFVRSCYLFDVPTTGILAYEAGTILIYKYVCPPGFSGTNPGVASYFGYCMPESGTEFTASHAPIVRNAVTDEVGTAEITGVPTGSSRISELPREGYDPPRVYCQMALAETGARSDLEEITVDNWGILYDLPDGYYLECVWYNLPAATSSTDPATIILHKYTCPEGTEDTSQLLETLISECTVRPEGIEFTTSPIQSTTSVAATTGPGGDVQFSNVAPGKLYVEETFNQGYVPLSVFCDFYVTATGSATNFSHFGVAGSTLSTYIAPGYTLECDWFNVPYIEPAYLTILKYVCTPDYGITGAAREDVLFNCTSPVANVPFEVATQDGPHQSPQFTDLAGIARFDDLPARNLTISELSHGYDTLRVYCGQAEYGSGAAPPEFLELEISSDSVQYPAEPYTEITCYWINRVSEFASVYVYKYACPSDYDPATADRQYFDGNCQDQPADVEFTLTPSSGGPQTSATDAEGQVRWNTLPAGQLELTESPPPGYQVVAVYCDLRPPEGETDPDPGLAETPYDGLLSYDVPSGYELVCEFFNAPSVGPPPLGSPTPSDGELPRPTPVDQTDGTGGTGGTGSTAGQGGGQTGGQPAGPAPDPDAPATLVITKYICPEDYDLYEPDADPTQECDELTDDIAFSLKQEGEELGLTQTTGDDEEGVVTFSDLEPGPYLLAETLPDNTLSAFIYTCVSDQREFLVENPFVPFAYAGPDGQIGVVLAAGETLECDWYNVPELPGSVTITKYWCAGEVIIPATCEIYADGIAFTLIPLEDGEDISLTTGEDGTTTAELEGEYEIIEDIFEWCFAESDAMDGSGNITIQPGVQVTVDIYNCGPQPGG